MIFRVDHFLSDELVRRVVSLRFLNRVFAPAWDTQSIERVDISGWRTSPSRAEPPITTAQGR